ncbi:MAG: response regulator [Candidatus Manganitrophus sp.]|nr:response regulator [Candidatus Manganitrophus sp.]WDT72400.1 MAG: response regulator [Candidatus Manganitrophus sp.]WDT80152.1 MAG: response regulator [Candidatus Manganitrophus sp.]
MKMLVVDDSAAMRSLLRQMIKKMGHSVTEAVNGKEALEQLNVHPDIGLILLDWNMPEMDGMQLLDALGVKRLNKRPRIIIVSTECEAEKIVQAMERGADEYIMKPFTQEILEEKLSILGIARD